MTGDNIRDDVGTQRLSRLVNRFFGSLPGLLLVALALVVAMHLAGKGSKEAG
jgi:hypothetical protein